MKDKTKRKTKKERVQLYVSHSDIPAMNARFDVLAFREVSNDKRSNYERFRVPKTWLLHDALGSDLDSGAYLIQKPVKKKNTTTDLVHIL